MPRRVGLLFTVFISQAAFSCGAVVARAPLTWWIVNSLTKVKPLDPLPNEPTKAAELYAGRNEFEAFQIVLRAEGKDLGDVDIDFSDLWTKEGARISKDTVTVYFEEFLNLTKPSSIEGGTGLWPDPLIPRVDRYVNEKRSAFPFTARSGRNQPLWVEFFIPPTAHPGEYVGAAHISFDGRVQFSVLIKLTVWNFSLPPTASLRSSFGLSGVAILKQHRGGYTNDADLSSMTRMYAKAALLHRVSIHGGTMIPPRFASSANIIQAPPLKIDWRTYDAEVAPFLDGRAIPEGDPLYGAKATSVELRAPAEFASEDQQVIYGTEWARHFQEKGWLDRLFVYLWDEPRSADFAKVLARGRVSMRAHSKVPNLVTVPFSRKLEEVVQTWVPLVNCLEIKPGFDDFCEETPPLESYASQPGRVRNLWFYQSCASHGCNIVGGQYFAGWPSYLIDMPGAANRVMQWIAWKYRIEGELYYNMDEAYGIGKDPWRSVFLVGGNGDGTLFYPGRPDRIGGRTDIPIESIRLKLIRKGMEDYEYLALLAKLGGRKTADQYADRIVRKPYLWESRPEAFLEVRREMGEALNRLQGPVIGSGNDPQ